MRVGDNSLASIAAEGNKQAVPSLSAYLQPLVEQLDPADWARHAALDGASAPAPVRGNPLAMFEADLVPVGAALPDVVVRDLDGRELALRELQGKTLLLNFWFFH